MCFFRLIDFNETDDELESKLYKCSIYMEKGPQTKFLPSDHEGYIIRPSSHLNEKGVSILTQSYWKDMRLKFAEPVTTNVIALATYVLRLNPYVLLGYSAAKILLQITGGSSLDVLGQEVFLEDYLVYFSYL